MRQGERGELAEIAADEVVDELVAFSNVSDGAAGPRSAAQLLAPLALATRRNGSTVSAIPGHLATVAATIRACLDREIRVGFSNATRKDGPGRATIA